MQSSGFILRTSVLDKMIGRNLPKMRLGINRALWPGPVVDLHLGIVSRESVISGPHLGPGCEGAAQESLRDRVLSCHV